LRDTAQGDARRLNDNLLLGVFSIPYIYDFFCGVMTIILMSRIAKFNEMIRKINHPNEEAQKLLAEVKNIK
jgi:hypothetical protein